MRKTRFLLIAFAVIALAIYVNSLVVPVSKGYEYFIHFAAELLNKKQRVDTIRTAFPASRFVLVQSIVYWGAIILALLFAIAVFFAKAIHPSVKSVGGRMLQSFRSTVATFKAVDKVAIGIFLFAVLYLIVQSIWYMYHLPFIHDEAYTISNFVLPGPLASVTFYPYPNNHILFSLFSYPFSFLPIKPEVAFRLPSLLAVVVTCFVLFKLLHQYIKPLHAALAVMVFVNMLPVMAYAIFARGYCLVFLFTGLSLYSLGRIVTNNSRYHKQLLVLFSVLGLYTVPSYMYPFATIFCTYFFYSITTRSWPLIREVVLSAIVCGFLTLLLYLPVIFTSGGWKAFVKVIYFGYDHTSSISKVWYFIDSVYALQFFENVPLTIAFLLLTLIVSVAAIIKLRKRDKDIEVSTFFYAALLGFLVPLISFVVQRKMVAPRTHTYAALFFVVFIFIALQIVVNARWRQAVFLTLTILMVCLNIALAHNSILLKGESYNDKTADLFSEAMLEERQTRDTCYTFDLFYLANLQLKYALAKRPVTVYQSQPGSPSTADFNYTTTYPWLITTTETKTVVDSSLQKLYVPAVVRKDATLWRRLKAE